MLPFVIAGAHLSSVNDLPDKLMSLPRFKEHSVSDFYRGRIREPRLKKSSALGFHDQMLTTKDYARIPDKWGLGEASRHPSFLAGHYFLADGSGGGNTHRINVVDAQTGYIY